MESDLTKYGYVYYTEVMPPQAMAQPEEEKPLIFRVPRLTVITTDPNSGRTLIEVEGIGTAMVKESVAEVCEQAGQAWGAIS